MKKLEVFFYLKDSKEEVDRINNIIEDSIKEVNNIVKLNVPLGASADYGKNYAEVH